MNHFSKQNKQVETTLAWADKVDVSRIDLFLTIEVKLKVNMRLTWARQLGQKVKQVQGQGQPWRDAASVIVVARDRDGISKSEFDYKLVMLRRSAKSKFMPNAYVFPGGATHKVL